MEFDFDKIVDRSAWHSKKLDKLEPLFGRKDILPLWIADMNFESPKCVQDELKRIASFDIYGYFSEPADYRDSIIDWYCDEYGWELKREWINFVPGLVHALSYAVHGLTREGDKILVQKPVYNSFFDLPEAQGRIIINNPLIACDSAPYYRMDLEDLEAKIVAEEKTGHPITFMILCNPQNPQGVRWTLEELRGVADICYRHKVLVISDESFCDLQLWGGKHIPFATVSKEAAENSITFATPTKTFNLSGLVTSFAIVSNTLVAEKFFKFLDVNEYNYPLFFSMMPSIAAYRKGRPWLTALIKYVEGNIQAFEQLCADFTDAEGNPLIKVQRPDTSYLVWTDCRPLMAQLAGKPISELTLKDHELLVDYFTNRVGVGLNYGIKYGEDAFGFVRWNLAIPRSQIMGIKFI